MLNYKWLPPKSEIGITDSDETLAMMDTIKEEIVTFFKKIGLSVADRLSCNKNIYILENRLYNKYVTPRKTNGGLHEMNEAAIKNNTNHANKIGRWRHELIHSALKQDIFIEVSEKSLHFVGKGFGYISYEDGIKKFETLTESLIEIINIQIDEKSKISAGGFRIAYVFSVIFIASLAGDMAARIRRDPRKRTLIKTAVDPKTKITKQFIIEYLIKGMTERDATRLEIISLLYDRHEDDKKTFDALKALSTMGISQNDTVRVAREFRLKKIARRIRKP